MKSEGSNTPKEKRILIVDDTSENIQVVASMLNEVGYRLNYATSGEKALQYVSEIKFDIILLDIMMPEMNGFEVCRRIKNNPKTRDVAIIFLTAKVDTKSITTAFEIGGVDYITKPFNKAELLARIKTHINLLSATRDLQHNILTRDKFYSIIAHDLKNPMSSLISFSSVLVEEFENLTTETLQDYHKCIYELSSKSYSLLENLLDWERSQIGQLVVSPRTFCIKEIIEETIDLVIDDAERKEVSLHSKIDERCGVYADPDMVRVVLRNLIVNAVKFTDKGGSITISSYSKDGQQEIAITDTGIGLSEKDKNNIFKIDVNPLEIGFGKEKGTGLGLILCKEFVDKNGGTIRVESELNKGSSFIISLPDAQK